MAMKHTAILMVVFRYFCPDLSLIISIGGLYLKFLWDFHQLDQAFSPFVIEDTEKFDVEITFNKSDGKTNRFHSDIALDGDKVVLFYPPAREKEIRDLRGCLMQIPLKQILALHNRFILHASFISACNKGILFSGDSGAGKSTQADLWHTYENSRIINGDRVILEKNQDGYLAHGSVFAGSSKIYLKETASVNAIVFLEKSHTNRIRRLDSVQAFRLLLKQTDLDNTSAVTVSLQCDLLEDLLEKVPVLLMECTPDQRAVLELKQYLMRENI